MNLFENLILYNESKILKEREDLSISEYNKLKFALNKNNDLKDMFVIHPGKTNLSGYQFNIVIYGAFKKYEDTVDTMINRGFSSKSGKGAELYKVSINLLDENINIVNYYNYEGYLKDTLNRYINNLKKSSDYKYLDSETLIKDIIDVIEKSKEDLITILKSKNFIYNLSGKAKTGSRWSDNKGYNLELESKLLEDFDPSMPNWLKKAIKVNNDSRSGGRKDLNYNIPFDKLKWTVETFPKKGKIADVVKNEIYALLIDKSGDKQTGDYVVYFPQAYIGNNETIYINGRNRSIDAMSVVALAPYVKEFAHAIDTTKNVSDLKQKQIDRAKAKDGSIDRVHPNDRDAFSYRTVGKLDKSGYIVDPDKYKKLLIKSGENKYAIKLDRIYKQLTSIRDEIKYHLFDNLDDMITKIDSSKYKWERDKPSKSLKDILDTFDKAVENYQNALSILDTIKGQNKTYSHLSSDWEKSFNKYLVECEYIITSISIAIKNTRDDNK